MSPLSAALTIHAWILTHGRPPLAGECRPENGLHYWTTYYETFRCNNFSAGILPLVASLVSNVKMRHCLGRADAGSACTAVFPDEGAHIRMCQRCRARWGHSDEPAHAVPMDARTLRTMGLDAHGWEDWARDIDWDSPLP